MRKTPGAAKPLKLLYDLIMHTDEHAFIHKVQEAIGLGWQPLGGVSIADNGETLVYAQALIRAEP